MNIVTKFSVYFTRKHYLLVAPTIEAESQVTMKIYTQLKAIQPIVVSVGRARDAVMFTLSQGDFHWGPRIPVHTFMAVQPFIITDAQTW